MSGYTKYTNLLTSYGAINHAPHWQPHYSKHIRGYLPESQYDTKAREVLDDFYPRALQWCSTDPVSDNLVSLDISKCYPFILIDNDQPIPLYTIHDIIKPFDGYLRLANTISMNMSSKND